MRGMNWGMLWMGVAVGAVLAFFRRGGTVNTGRTVSQ
jgi:hypothetical protein